MWSILSQGKFARGVQEPTESRVGLEKWELGSVASISQKKQILVDKKGTVHDCIA